MPKRQDTHRHDSKDVQGEGSYVVVRDMTVAELLAYLERTAIQESRPDTEVGKTFEENAASAVKLVVDWNWVDDQGQPLPLPSAAPEVLRMLTGPELRFIRDLQRPFAGSSSPS